LENTVGLKKIDWLLNLNCGRAGEYIDPWFPIIEALYGGGMKTTILVDQPGTFGLSTLELSATSTPKGGQIAFRFFKKLFFPPFIHCLWPLDEHYLILISKNWVQFILRK
jgi:hypothetical protein